LLANIANLSIPLYVKRQTNNASINDDQPQNLAAAWAQWLTDGRVIWQQMDAFVETWAA